MKNISLIICLFLTNTLLSQNLINNGDFELGTNALCDCATDFICNNDAGRVVDGVHPIYSANDAGCVTDGTSYTNSLGAHGGTGYLYFYAGSDFVSSTPNFNIAADTLIQMCIWYAGPQGQGGSGQNTANAHFSFGIDGLQVGPDVQVPEGTTWTQYCFVMNIPAGNHSFDILSGGGAPYSFWLDDFSVEYHCIPDLNIGNDTTLCQGETLTLDATTPDASYLWQDGSTNSTYTVSQSGTYWVQITDSCGSATDSVYVSYYPTPTLNLGNDTTICAGETLTLNATNTNVTYLWQDGSTNATYTVSQPGTYWAQLTDNCGSGSINDSINIDYYPAINLDLGNNTTICEGDTLMLDATTLNATYSWQDNSSAPIFDVTQQGLYWALVTVDNCSNSDTIAVSVEDCDFQFEIPNVFTPNDDGLNDFFTPIALDGIDSMNTTIYNRWGNKVFESDEPLFEWDGANACEGTYYWLIQFIDHKGEETTVNGIVTLFK